MINTHGDFGGRTNLSTGQVAGFIPKAANASLSWRHRGFSTRVLYNFTGSHITSYSATSPALNLHRFDRNTVNVGVAYQIRATLTVTCDVANLFNEPQKLYAGFRDRTQDTIINFVTVTVGVSGRFLFQLRWRTRWIGRGERMKSVLAIHSEETADER